MKDDIKIYPETKKTLELADLLPLEEYIEKKKVRFLVLQKTYLFLKNVNCRRKLIREITVWFGGQKTVFGVAKISFKTPKSYKYSLLERVKKYSININSYTVLLVLQTTVYRFY